LAAAVVRVAVLLRAAVTMLCDDNNGFGYDRGPGPRLVE